MKRFSRFLLEDNGFKEGSVLEGIFAIAVATYLRDGEYNEREINKYRRKIEPSLFKTGTVDFEFDPVWDQIGKKPKDTFNVSVKIQLKMGEVVKGGKISAFGDDGEMRYMRSGDIGNLGKKIKLMLKDLPNSSAQKKIDGFVNKLLQNNTKDEVDLIVNAAGAEGESSGGLTKGDVFLTIYANKKKKPIGKLSFSLKSSAGGGTATMANISAWKGMQGLSKAWGNQIKMGDLPASIVNLVQARIPAGLKGNAKKKAKQDKQKAMIKVWNLMIDKMSAASLSSTKQRNLIFQLLDNAAFGTDRADVIDLSGKGIKEIDKDSIEELKHKPYYSSYSYRLEYIKASAEGDVGYVNAYVTHPDGKGGRNEEKIWHIRGKFHFREKKSKPGHFETELKVLFEGHRFLHQTDFPVDPGYDQETKKLLPLPGSEDSI